MGAVKRSRRPQIIAIDECNIGNYEVQCHMDEVTARDKENEQIRAQVARMKEELEGTSNERVQI